MLYRTAADTDDVSGRPSAARRVTKRMLLTDRASLIPFEPSPAAGLTLLRAVTA